MKYKKLKEINEYVSKSISPMAMPEQKFEMYSVPIYDTGHPEYLFGSEIASNKLQVQKNDVLLCKINPRINRVWVVADESEYPCIASSEWIVIRNSEYNPEFLAWYFRSSKFQQLMVSEVTGIGGSLTRAQPKAIAEYPVPIVERTEQDKIVNVLNKINSVITARKTELQKLDDLVKSRFVEMFGDPISNDKGWNTDPLTAVCSRIYGGGTPSKSHLEYFEGSIPWVSPKDMKSDVITDSIDHITEEAIANSTTNLVPEGSVLMVIRSGILKHDLPVSINAVPVTINQDMKAFVPGENITASFLRNYFKAIELDVLAGVRGVTADNIDFKTFQQRKIIVPPIHLQEEFEDFCRQVDKSKVAVQKSLDEMQVLFDALMQKYFG